jgi:hypothetical protein
MLLLLVLGCFDLFVDFIHNVALKRKWQIYRTSRNQKQMLAFSHLQGMQIKKVGMNFSMCLFHAPT